MIGSNQCEHGSLARSCLTCEYQGRAELAERTVAHLRGEIERLEAKAAAARRAALEPLREAVALVEKHAGCGDNSCLFVKPGGMATNGGCRCVGRDGGHRPFVPQALANLFKQARALLDDAGRAT